MSIPVDGTPIGGSQLFEGEPERLSIKEARSERTVFVLHTEEGYAECGVPNIPNSGDSTFCYDPLYHCDYPLNDMPWRFSTVTDEQVKEGKVVIYPGGTLGDEALAVGLMTYPMRTAALRAQKRARTGDTHGDRSPYIY